MAKSSPTPWRVSHGYIVIDSDGVSIANAWRDADAAYIVEAVNERDRLRDLVGKLAARLQLARLMGFGLPEREKLLDEAREALGEGEQCHG